jgi:fatty-acyl-CoA synthase
MPWEDIMLGLMQEWPLLCHKVIDHAANCHGDREVVSRSVEGPVHRTTYRDTRTRALAFAKRLEREGVKPGDRIASIAWNTWRHLEAWYGITGLGAVYHTLNPRLFPEQLTWIMNDAEDSILFVDLTFLPLIEKIAPSVPSLRKIIVLTDRDHMPDTALANVACYEEWLAESDRDFTWRSFDERTAAGMCYTSGTTGNPKGVVYSHRSNVLHAMTTLFPDVNGISCGDTVMPVVPFFHANAWATAFSVPMAGARLVLPGPGLDGRSIYEMLTRERVTLTLAVPTVWAALLRHMEEEGGSLPDLDRVVIGGSAVPKSMIRTFGEKYGVKVWHGWGMTEMSPIGTISKLNPEHDNLPTEDKLDILAKQGLPFFTVEMKITDDDDHELPHDGRTFGRLKVRGPAIAASYYKGRSAEQFDAEQWFDTGDVAHIDENGYMQVTDRSKDVIKSGGEWISSIELENLAVGHPDVAEAAVIGAPHPKWAERPLLIIVRKPDRQPEKTDILAFMEGKVAKWWIPDDVIFVDAIPHTATGKILKTELRVQMKDYRFPGCEG